MLSQIEADLIGNYPDILVIWTETDGEPDEGAPTARAKLAQLKQAIQATGKKVIMLGSGIGPDIQGTNVMYPPLPDLLKEDIAQELTLFRRDNLPRGFQTLPPLR